MLELDSHHSGRHFLQIPGPTNVPDRILRAMDHPTIDHRGPEFNALAKKVLRSVRQIFQTKQPVIVFPASGTGAWEAALVNTLSPGDTVLAARFGMFSHRWIDLCQRHGLNVQIIETPWGQGAPLAEIEAALARLAVWRAELAMAYAQGDLEPFLARLP